MESNRALKLLDAAYKGGYGMPAIASYNIEGIIAIVRGAEAKRSPAMILLFPWAIEYAGGLLVHVAAEAARNASVPITVHLDHAQTPDVIRRAAEIGGFDSIMVDMSHYEKEENLALTLELTKELHAKGIASEAEPGRIEGGEDGVGDTADLEGLLTTPEEAKEFADTGIDWLAPAFGNVHGNYGPRGIQLEYDRLVKIHEAVGKRVRLVLHGADPYDKELHQKCIGLGIAKVNINKGMNAEYTRVLQQRAEKASITSLIEETTTAMQHAVENVIDMLGSAGKA